LHNPQPLASCDAAGPRIRTWRMRTVLDFHQGGLGAISSSRCQTTRARTGEPARARIFLGFWTSRTGARGALHKRAAAFHRPNLRAPNLRAEFTGPNLRGPRLCARHVKSASRSIDCRSGGARRDRTDDLLLAKQALSQLSYGPPQASGIRYQRSVIRNATCRSSDY
jgi:hypothetical protein